MKHKKDVPNVDIDGFLDCSLEAVNDPNVPIKFRVEPIENIHPKRVELLAARENLVRLLRDGSHSLTSMRGWGTN